MNVIYKNNSIILENTTDFDLTATFECGQCFRFDRLDDSTYFGVACGHEITLSQDGKTITLYNTKKSLFDDFWFDFFDLGRDYAKIRKELAQSDPVLKEASRFAPGIRILKQNPWEALCSFIISQQKQIPNIKNIIAKMSEAFGNKIDKSFSFPSAETLAKLKSEDIAFLKLGYRDKYVLKAASMVANGEINLENIKEMPVCDARAQLKTISGVGTKVADCTLLYGMQRLDVSPIDTWMKKAEKLYEGGFTFLQSPYAGIAQQYLFYYMRANKIKPE